LKTNFQYQIGSPISFAAAYSSNTCFLRNCAVFQVNAQKLSKMKISDEQRLEMIRFFHSKVVTVAAGLLQGGFCKRSMLKKPEIFISRQFNVRVKIQNLTLRRQNITDGRKQLSSRKMSIKWDKCLMKGHSVQSETLRLLTKRNYHYQRLLFGGFC
jgi:hypothetical protein